MVKERHVMGKNGQRIDMSRNEQFTLELFTLELPIL